MSADDNKFLPTGDNAWAAYALGQEWWLATGIKLPFGASVEVLAPGRVIVTYAVSGALTKDITGAWARVAPSALLVESILGLYLEYRNDREDLRSDVSAWTWCATFVETWTNSLGNRWKEALWSRAKQRETETLARIHAEAPVKEAAFWAAFEHIRSGGEPTEQVVRAFRGHHGVGQPDVVDLPDDTRDVSGHRAQQCAGAERIADLSGVRAVLLSISSWPLKVKAVGADIRYSRWTPPTAAQFHLPTPRDYGRSLDLTDADARGASLRYIRFVDLRLDGAKLDGLEMLECALPWRTLRMLQRTPGVKLIECVTYDVIPRRHRRWSVSPARRYAPARPQHLGAPLPVVRGPRACPRYTYIQSLAQRAYARLLVVANDQTAPVYVARRAWDAACEVYLADGLLSGRYRGLRHPTPSTARLEAAWAVITRAAGYDPTTRPFTAQCSDEDGWWADLRETREYTLKTQEVLPPRWHWSFGYASPPERGRPEEPHEYVHAPGKLVPHWTGWFDPTPAYARRRGGVAEGMAARSP